MVDGQFDLYYIHHNCLLFFDDMADTSGYEESLGIQLEKCAYNLQYHNGVG